MGTYTEKALRQHMAKMAREQPNDYAFYAVLGTELGRYPRGIVDSITQPFMARGRGAGDGYVFGQLWTRIFSGELLHAEIETGRRPGNDSAVEYNNSVLAQLPEPFSGTFSGGLDEGDGMLRWSKPIRLTQTILDWATGREESVEIEVAPGEALLEVGCQPAARTFEQLSRGDCLARWPYGHEAIYLFNPTRVSLREAR